MHRLSQTAFLRQLFAQPYFDVLEVSRDLHGWQDQMYVAAINCGDEANQEVCNFHNVTHYPTLKVCTPAHLRQMRMRTPIVLFLNPYALSIS